MYWLYFARDFYRASTQTPTASATPERKASAPLNSTQYKIHSSQHAAPVMPAYPLDLSGPVIKPVMSAPAAPDAAASSSAYLQRLSVEGDHAFGIWDEEAGFSMFSANFERITGLSSGECAGHDWIHAIHADQQYAINEALLNAKHGINGRCLVQACSRNSADGWRWLMIDVKAPTPRQPSIMVLLRDLTDQKALEETLKQMQSTLAMSERSRSAFLSSMSHELRTPLNAIMGFSEMMKSGVFGKMENPTYAQYAEHIHDSGSTLLGKINDLLDIASMDVGGMELDEEEFLLPAMLNEVLEIHTHMAFTRGIKLKLDCPLPIELGADRAKLLCATSHLVGNAVRHSTNDSEITLSVRVQPDDGVIISVRDSGEGISQAQLDVIRAALEAEVAYFNIESGGIGLGLSLAKELAARHGGRVMLDSIRHRGTVVSLILPTARIARGVPQKRRRN